MVNQPKRIDFTSALAGVAGQISSRFGPGTGSILRRLTNYHNIWWSFGVEPQDAGANANGNWVLWLKSNTNESDTVWSTANLDTDDFNMQIIACGVWVASNEGPYTFSSNMQSSRNLVANQELILSVHQAGITAGQSRIVTSLCAGVSVK